MVGTLAIVVRHEEIGDLMMGGVEGNGDDKDRSKKGRLQKRGGGWSCQGGLRLLKDCCITMRISSDFATERGPPSVKPADSAIS